MNRYHFSNGAGEHAHYLDDRPLVGTSRVGTILAKPLTWWASGLAVQTFGCKDPKVLTKLKRGKATSQEKTDHFSSLRAAHSLIKGMTDDQYAKLIDTAYRAHQVTLKDKASTGTDLHAELERFVIDHMKVAGMQMPLFTNYDPKIQPFIDWSNDNVKRFLWAEANCYSEELWTGGISDAGYEDKEGNFGIIDFKSAKSAYFEHFAQIAGYDIALSENGALTADGDLLYKLEKPITRYAVVAFGAENVVPQFHESPIAMRRIFRCMLEIYKAMPQDQ